MSKDIIKYSLRLEAETYKKIQLISDKNKRSVNMQIDFIIESYITEFEKFNGKIEKN